MERPRFIGGGHFPDDPSPPLAYTDPNCRTARSVPSADVVACLAHHRRGVDLELLGSPCTWSATAVLAPSCRQHPVRRPRSGRSWPLRNVELGSARLPASQCQAEQGVVRDGEIVGAFPSTASGGHLAPGRSRPPSRGLVAPPRLPDVESPSLMALGSTVSGAAAGGSPTRTSPNSSRRMGLSQCSVFAQSVDLVLWAYVDVFDDEASIGLFSLSPASTDRPGSSGGAKLVRCAPMYSPTSSCVRSAAGTQTRPSNSRGAPSSDPTVRSDQSCCDSKTQVGVSKKLSVPWPM